MDFKATIDLIIKDLNEASEIIDDLKKCPGVPELQVELAKSKCRSAGEVIALLKNINYTEPAKDEPIHEQPKKAEFKEPAEKPAESSTIADKFNHTGSLYDEKTGVIKAEKDLSDQLKAKSMSSISEAIGISDKFLFMGEIFNGNKETYNQAISRLDKAETIQDAMAIIMSYTGEKTENDAVKQLLDLVRLKLSVNE